ncbi:hypothetical protein J4411_04045 [Candidatus Pacearchaeota archaeon]|nr:hypothetical protein [Candidatus Pacearchaeota archaeon]
MRKKGQVWVETVTYTLIAFVLIGLVLAFVKPKIDELQDKALIEQSINVLRQVDSVVNEVYQDGVGNKRLLGVTIREGEFNINSVGNSISFSFIGNYMYSEPGQNYSEGSFDIRTTKLGSDYKVFVERKYPIYDITYGGANNQKVLVGSSSPYQLFITNKGGTVPVIDFSLQ